MRRRSLLLLPALLLAFPVLPAPDASADAPGRVARLRLGSADPAPRAMLDGQRLMVRRERGQWVALAGIPLSAKAGARLKVEVTYGNGKRVVRRIAVLDKKYAMQHLTVPPDQAELPPEQLALYQQQREHLTRVLRTFTEAGPAGLDLLQPVDGRRSGTFGLRRVINGNPRSPHNGMDLAAPTGTPVVAPIDGRVIDVGDYLFLGRTLVLDHGQGLLTLYAHLSAVHAAPGETVAAGATIGDVGMTGRVTGPHLHFSVYLNAVAVDPEIFLRPQ
jgi:murein DD-endopeptidase MepM/ murein hydrolase activator NlpD